jgi:hypothetical protein
MPTLLDPCPSTLGFLRLPIIERNSCEILIRIIIRVITEVREKAGDQWVAYHVLRTR